MKLEDTAGALDHVVRLFHGGDLALETCEDRRVGGVQDQQLRDLVAGVFEAFEVGGHGAGTGYRAGCTAL